MICFVHWRMSGFDVVVKFNSRDELLKDYIALEIGTRPKFGSQFFHAFIARQIH
jgi:hypothetical protein